MATWRHLAYGNADLAHSATAGNPKVVEIDKKCVSTLLLCFMPEIGYNYRPAVHMMISKLHLLSSAAH